MGFSLFDICRALLLILNAMAILNERRFLVPYGIVPPNGASASPTAQSINAGGFSNDFDFGAGSGAALAADNGGQVSVKQQVGQLLFSVRLLLRWPLVIANVVMVALTIVFG